MVAKVVCVLFASAVLLQTISAQCIGNGYGNGLGFGLNNFNNFNNFNNLAGARLNNAGCGFGAGSIAPTQAAAVSNGGGLTVSSSSPLAPTGVTVVSENAIEGAVEVGGELPLLAGVALEGALPTAGSADTEYTCGNGQVGITSESLSSAGVSAGVTASPARPTLATGLLGTTFSSGAFNPGFNSAYGLNGAGFSAANRFSRPCGCAR